MTVKHYLEFNAKEREITKLFREEIKEKICDKFGSAPCEDCPFCCICQDLGDILISITEEGILKTRGE